MRKSLTELTSIDNGRCRQADRVNLFSPWLYGRQDRLTLLAAVEGVEAWALGMSVQRASPMHVLWPDYTLSISANQAQDTDRRVVSEPLPGVTS